MYEGMQFKYDTFGAYVMFPYSLGDVKVEVLNFKKTRVNDFIVATESLYNEFLALV